MLINKTEKESRSLPIDKASPITLNSHMSNIHELSRVVKFKKEVSFIAGSRTA